MLKKFSRLFIKDERGYVAAMFGIMVLPLLAIIGGAIDYRNIGREYANLRSAAEAAALAVARSQFKPAAGASGATENPMQLMQSVFYTNFPQDSNKYSYLTPTLTFVDPAAKEVTVKATAGVKTITLQMIGISVYDLIVEAKAGAAFSDKNVDLYLAFDLSPSMGAPADGTPPPMDAEGCFFSCHDSQQAIRSAGKVPKLDVIRINLAGNTGLIQAVADAAASNPTPISVFYWVFGFEDGARTMFTSIAPAWPRAILNNFTSNIFDLGQSGTSSRTDLNASFKDIADTIMTRNQPANRSVIVIISDGMHSRAKEPFNPAFCDTLKGLGDVYTFYVKYPESVYDNPNWLDKIPSDNPASAPYSRDAFYGGFMNVIRNGTATASDSDRGYYSGLNNAPLLMKTCASKESWYFSGELFNDINNGLDAMTQAIIAPEIRVIN